MISLTLQEKWAMATRRQICLENATTVHKEFNALPSEWDTLYDDQKLKRYAPPSASVTRVIKTIFEGLEDQITDKNFWNSETEALIKERCKTVSGDASKRIADGLLTAYRNELEMPSLDIDQNS